MRRSQRSPRYWGRNCLALLVAASAVGAVQFHSDPLSVGGSPSARAGGAPRMAIPPPPPLPTVLESPRGKAGETAEQSAPARSRENPHVLRGIWATKMSASLIEKGCQSFEKIPDYTATLFKQERIGGSLGEGQRIELKMRHEPFSVYMKWISGDPGRQLIYVKGHNEGNLLVQPGGIKGRLTGVLRLEPTGSMAMSESRHPVTQAGLLELARTILKYQRQDLKRGEGFTVELHDGQSFEERPCFLYTILYESPQVNAEYRKSLIYIDKELSMPVCVKNYTWAKDADPEKIDEETLVEFYAYTDLQMGLQLGSADFDQHNGDYRLRVRR